MTKEISVTKIAPGLTGVCVKTSRFKSSLITVTFALPMKAETVSQNALLPYLLHMNCNAYPKISSFNSRLAELYGAAVSASAEKLGDIQLLRIAVTFLDDRFALDGQSISEECAKLLGDIIFRPVLDGGKFTAENVEREKRILLESLDGEFNEKRIYALKRLEQIMCENEPYGIDRLGTAESITAITPESAAEAWNYMLSSAKVHINVIGSIDSGRVFEILGKEFSAVDGKRIENLSSDVVLRPEKVKNVEEKMEVAQSKLVMGMRTGTESRELEKNSYIFSIMADVFGGGPYSRLFMNVREKLSLCYYCSARFVKQKGILIIQSGVENKNVKAAEEEIMRQFEVMKNGEFTDEELESSKLAILDMLGTVGDSLGAADAWYYRQMCSEEFITPEEYAERVRSVTRDEIAEAAGRCELDTVYVLAGEAAEDKEGIQ